MASYYSSSNFSNITTTSIILRVETVASIAPTGTFKRIRWSHGGSIGCSGRLERLTNQVSLPYSRDLIRQSKYIIHDYVYYERKSRTDLGTKTFTNVAMNVFSQSI